jgi:ribosomal subunit interface protein
MTTPLDVVFNNMEPSEAVATRVKEKVARLAKKFDRFTHARVVIDAPHRHQQRGKIFQVKIDLGLPGRANIVINKASHDHVHEDVYAALRDGFLAAERQLQDGVDRMTGHVKTLRGGKQAKAAMAAVATE